MGLGCLLGGGGFDMEINDPKDSLFTVRAETERGAFQQMG